MDAENVASASGDHLGKKGKGDHNGKRKKRGWEKKRTRGAYERKEGRGQLEERGGRRGEREDEYRNGEKGEGNFMARADATTFCSQKVCRLSLGSEEEGTFGITGPSRNRKKMETRLLFKELYPGF